MPAPVDRDLRRRQLVVAASRVLARSGMDSLTTRAVTDEAGTAKGTFSHYFDDKAELLRELVRFHHARSGERIIEALSGQASVEALRQAMLEALPLDAERLADAQVEVSFAAASIGDPNLAAWYRRRRQHLHRLLVERLTAIGDLDGHRLRFPAPDAAMKLLTLIDGLSLQAMFDQSEAHRARQRMELDDLLASIVDTSL